MLKPSQIRLMIFSVGNEMGHVEDVLSMWIQYN